MTSDEFIGLLIKYDLMDPLFKDAINYIIKPFEENEDVIKLIAIYFSYLYDGSICMPLDSRLKTGWQEKCKGESLMLDDDSVDNNELDALSQDGSKAIDSIACLYASKLLSDDSLFKDYKGFLYAKKYFNAKEGIKNSINRLFSFKENHIININVLDFWPSAKEKQIEVISKGIGQNLIVTGGPGTGKTTSVFYLLLMLLKKYPDYEIYLTAPSGKAASRIKESINEAIAKVSFKGFDKELGALAKLKEYTIHRLLGFDFEKGSFIYNHKKQFNSHSIFIIDEASMIDACLFDSLLEAIPTGARVFILGDKYQLPSVECGAVLADLLDCPALDDKKVELVESNRFSSESEIGVLARKINQEEEIKDVLWKPAADFSLDNRNGNYPVYYYDIKDNYDDFKKIIEKWAVSFWQSQENLCQGVKFDVDSLDNVFKIIDDARILTCLNKGRYGVSSINNLVKNYSCSMNITNKNSYNVGMPVMITKNNSELDLYNGDTGIIVSLEGLDTLFLLIEKNNEKYKNDSLFAKDELLKLGKYMLYPLRMLDLSKMMLAYAITVHKAQGSGYKNIMVILPNKSGHPMLNKQILYTAITRTKGNSYILASESCLNEAVKRTIERYTRIFD